MTKHNVKAQTRPRLHRQRNGKETDAKIERACPSLNLHRPTVATWSTCPCRSRKCLASCRCEESERRTHICMHVLFPYQHPSPPGPSIETISLGSGWSIPSRLWLPSAT